MGFKINFSKTRVISFNPEHSNILYRLKISYCTDPLYFVLYLFWLSMADVS